MEYTYENETNASMHQIGQQECVGKSTKKYGKMSEFQMAITQ